MLDGQNPLTRIDLFGPMLAGKNQGNKIKHYLCKRKGRHIDLYVIRVVCFELANDLSTDLLLLWHYVDYSHVEGMSQ